MILIILLASVIRHTQEKLQVNIHLADITIAELIIHYILRFSFNVFMHK